MKRLLLAVWWIGLSMATAGVAAPIDDARLKGLAWLMSHQSGDGSWHGAPGLEVAATASAVEALSNAGVTKGDTYAAAVAWLQNHQADSTDALARQAVALSKAGRDASGLISRLIAGRNDTTLSWGAYDHYGGSFPDTSLVMDAINIAGATYADTAYGIGFIANKQNTDGGWPYFKGDLGTPPSKVIPTAHNLLTLTRHKSVYAVQSYINNGIAWLKAPGQQKEGGGFGEGSSGTLLETALAYRALVAELGTGDPAAINAQNHLIVQQQSDGGWGGNDALLTALILAALPSTTLADADSDGLPDGVETPALLGTNPSVPDGRVLAQGNGQSVSGVTTAVQLPQATLNQAYTANAGGGPPPAAWSLLSGRLPDGLSLDPATGQISGTPLSAGAFNFIYRIASATGQTEVAAQIEVVSPALTSTAVPALPEAATMLLGAWLALILLHGPRKPSRHPR